ncbi:phosphoribosylglycinamide formyltransferase [Aliarcobacter butzleri]|uniref:Phosphoribosylglycinamide formyltransferase n=2 Tax=Aliarcobacter butzleri TaxID=28197 RepID=A0AAW7Q9I9_9BACT|nr:phosphoribosylglycinamide formyltransferase [Aliarcobacter butzleri]KLD97128.1 phosphoribosylglycinamide formyltransferase [Aliarcobacter butzleri L349]MCG3672750.1 phosphoribosylglycinamide formyltransferase [Aliarcobacter butzleri]MCG3691147.1 phosphoribosylglycinamide formyltransferase [Aliarcobacter butzleri]MDN5107767.1 phosphoribosylglycinamide formyltransferase [Aliarcobacter butzleri]MDN5123053.1 phosphoribosylglycinamide formyltransferase [Aliarcobacter butzleri]
MTKIGILASYNGSGFETIQKAIENKILDAKVVVVITNNTNAGVLEKAESYNIPYFIINDKRYPGQDIDDKITRLLLEFGCDYIFLSGYMKKIESKLLKAYPNKIINTHPAILPSIYGGVGMYGRFVHEAVIKNGEKESGVTIHFVNEVYDEGEKILVKKLKLEENETVDTLEEKIKNLEKEAIVEAFKKILGYKPNILI